MSSPNSQPLTDDAVLLSLVADGDQAAFTDLMSRFMRPLTVFATRFLSSKPDGEDIAQTVFIEVWEKAGTFDPSKASVKTWLYSIARNRCIDAIRKRRLRQFIGLDSPLVDIGSTNAEPSQIAADRAELRAVINELDLLPDRQRLALLLQTVSDMSTREIAETMSTSDGAVEQLIRRARQTIRQKFEYNKVKSNGVEK